MQAEPPKDIVMSAQEKSELSTMNSFYKLIKEMEPVDKTIIIYDVYKEDTKNFLSNLHSIAAGILSQQVEVRGVYQQDPDDTVKYIIFNECDIKKAQKAGLLDVSYFKVDEKSVEQQQGNIRLYHSRINDQKVRVVTLPIENRLTNKAQVEDINDKIKKIENENHQKSKQLKGQALEDFRNTTQKEIQDMKDQYCSDMSEKHQKMFNIEALLYAIRAKTKLISVCGLINSNQTDPEKNIKSLSDLMDNLFDVSDKGRQFIIHSATNLKKIPAYQALQAVSSVWIFERDGKCVSSKNECFNEKYFTLETKNIKSKIYKLLSEGRNQYLAKVIEDFVKAWTNITFSSSTCIAPVVKRVYQALSFDEDLTTSFIDLSQSMKKQALELSKASSNQKIPEQKQTFTVYTFNEVFSKFGVAGIANLRQNTKLQYFYTRQRLGNIKVEKGEQTIPKEIQLLTFIHYFYKINRQFCDGFAAEEKKGQASLQVYVKAYLKTVYELVSGINQNESLAINSISCPNMQKYYDFLDFLFESSTLICSITNRQLPICNTLKAFFDNLIPQENKLLTFILNNEEHIKQGQPVHYYDLYLKIIRENSKGFENKIEHIYVMIHRFKADQISARFIYEKQRVVEAIKSYSEIIHQYNRIVEAKRDKINKLDIEKRIARLLLVIGLPDEAVLIYQKNHLVKSAEKCFKQILQEYHGDDKAKKYMEFGKYLEGEFSFAKAIDYYESAYEAAKSIVVRQECIKRKLQCVLHSSNLLEAEKRIFERYYKGIGTESEFFSYFVVEQGTKSQSQFSRLRNRLQWNEQKQESMIMEDDENMKEQEMIA